MDRFKLVSEYRPTGDQPHAIEKLLSSLERGNIHQTLLGVTGSGKTFTMANVIEKWNRPTLILAHNKTLAAQLFQEFKLFFPENAVEYFVSYYDYYQPEAYLPGSDTYIEKDSSINEKIEGLRLSATRSLLSRRDVVVVASVSCIYGLGSPEIYGDMSVTVLRAISVTGGNYFGSWHPCSTSGRCLIQGTAHSGCGGMWWKSSLLTRKREFGSDFLKTKWRLYHYLMRLPESD